MMNPEHRKLLEQEMVQFLFEGKTCTSKATRRRKNSKGPAAFKNKHNTHARNDEKYLALALIAPLLVSCSSSNKKAPNTTRPGQGHERIRYFDGPVRPQHREHLGYNEVLLAGPKDYVKYTDQYQTRSHINFDEGTITVETIAGTDPRGRLRRAIVKTLLMGDDPNSIDLYSDVDDIQISKEPFLYGGGG